MKRSILLLVVILAPAFGLPQTQSALPMAQVTTAGLTQSDVTHVKLRLTEDLSSADAKVGQTVWLEVVDPVEIHGKVIIAAGAHARESVTRARKRGHNRRDGQLQFTVSTVSEIDGTEAHLFAAGQKGSGRGEPMLGPCTFPLPADPAGLFRKGKDVVIPKGTELRIADTAQRVILAE